MNRVHNACRNALTIEHVNDIMTNILLGPDIKDFNPLVIFEMWMQGPKGESSEHGRYLRGKLRNRLRNAMQAVDSGDLPAAMAKAGM